MLKRNVPDQRRVTDEEGGASRVEIEWAWMREQLRDAKAGASPFQRKQLDATLQQISMSMVDFRKTDTLTVQVSLLRTFR